MTLEQEEKLYNIWGNLDLYEEDMEFALTVAQDEFPNLKEDEIISLFMDFLIDNP